MSKPVNVEVSIHECRGDTNKLIRKFIKKVKKLKILEEYRERMFYEKPSQKRRKEKAKRRRVAQKAELEKREKLKIKYD